MATRSIQVRGLPHCATLLALLPALRRPRLCAGLVFLFSVWLLVVTGNVAFFYVGAAIPLSLPLAILSFPVGLRFYRRFVHRPLRVGTVVEAREDGLLMSTDIGGTFTPWSSINAVRPGRFHLEIEIAGFAWPVVALAQQRSQEAVFREFAGECRRYMDLAITSQKSTQAALGNQPVLSGELESRACGLSGAGVAICTPIETPPRWDRIVLLRMAAAVVGALVLIGAASFRLARNSGAAPAKAAQLSSLAGHAGVLTRRVFRRPYEFFGIVQDDSSGPAEVSDAARRREEAGR